jgi:hypothetical protein
VPKTNSRILSERFSGHAHRKLLSRDCDNYERELVAPICCIEGGRDRKDNLSRGVDVVSVD